MKIQVKSINKYYSVGQNSELFVKYFKSKQYLIKSIGYLLLKKHYSVIEV